MSPPLPWAEDRTGYSGARWRVFCGAFELFAYEDGSWMIYLSANPWQDRAEGQEANADAAKERAIHVCNAMSADLRRNP